VTAPGKDDQSEQLDLDPGSGRVEPDPAATGDARTCGRIESIADAGAQGLAVVTLEGTRPAEERRFSIDATSLTHVGLQQGDPIMVSIRVQRVKIHRVVDALVADEQGRVLLSYSQSGDAEFAPGFAVEPGPIHKQNAPHVPGSAERIERGLRIAALDKTAFTKAGAWRKLTTSQGVFAVTGSSVEWTPGKRPPDASSYRSFTILRLEGPG
jgi:hypothetical protein